MKYKKEVKTTQKKQKAQHTIMKSFTNYKAQYMVIKFYDDYTSLVSKARYNAIHRKGREVLTPKPVLHRTPVPVAKAKSANALVTNNETKDFKFD